MRSTAAERGLAAGAFYLAGSAVAVLAATDPRAPLGLVLWVAASGAVAGLVAILARRRFSTLVSHMASAAGSALLAIVVVAAGGGWGSVVVACCYPFVAVHAALFFSRRAAAAHLAWAAVTAGAAAVTVVPSAAVMPVLAVAALVSGTLAGVTSLLVTRLQTLATTDPLTGVANRGAFLNALDHARATVGRTGEPLSLVVLDLDGFKEFNDTHGHQGGDELLRDATARWRRALRARDTLARLGGDEFAAVLPGTGVGGALLIADRLLEVTPEAVFCSAGVAQWNESDDNAGLLEQADKAMYEAKRTPGNHVVATPPGVAAAPGGRASAGTAR